MHRLLRTKPISMGRQVCTTHTPSSKVPTLPLFCSCRTLYKKYKFTVYKNKKSSLQNEKSSFESRKRGELHLSIKAFLIRGL